MPSRGNSLYLLKNVSLLRLTYQIRLRTFRAMETNCKLIIRVPKMCEIHSSLTRFRQENSKIIQIEKV